MVQLARDAENLFRLIVKITGTKIVRFHYIDVAQTNVTNAATDVLRRRDLATDVSAVSLLLI